MRKRFGILFVAAFVSMLGAAACGGVQEQVQEQAEEAIQGERTQVEEQIQEGQTQVEEALEEAIGGQ